MANYYDWQATMSRQTGTNGELCMVIGGKGIGKTFGLRLKCVERFLKTGELFVEVCRTKDERRAVMDGYFDKLQNEGYFKDYQFKCEKACGYIARVVEDEKPEWRLCCYFVALTCFQQEKKRTFVKPRRFIFDEAVIDEKDRYHRYLPDEFLILANLLDSISRQQPGDEYQYYVYFLCNAVNLTCPYFQNLGIRKLPGFGYSWHRDKTVLVHYVDPWDSDERKARTLVGRMLEGHEESSIVFDNEFRDTSGREVMAKTPNAKYRFALRWGRLTFAIWEDGKRGLWFVTTKLPKNSANIYVLAKKDSSIDYQVLRRAEPLAKLLSDVYYLRGLRYESPATREAFFEVLAFLGVK